MNDHALAVRDKMQAVDTITMKAEQIHSLMATIVAAIGTGDLPQMHLSNVLWLAGDLAEKISTVASNMTP
jgi:hypothetical protein